MQNPKNTTSSCKQFVYLNCAEKAKYFNDFFSQQCKPIVNSSVFPVLYFFTEKRIDHITVKTDEITVLSSYPSK